MAVPASALDLTAVFAPDPGAGAWLAIAPVAILMATGALLSAIRRSIWLHAPLAIAAIAASVVIEILLLRRVLETGPVEMALGRWWPPFGIAFTVDAFGAVMALLAGIVTLGCAVHALSDVDMNHRRYGFFPFVCFLLAGVTGAFLTGDIFNLYVWFEVLLISSFGLLVLGGEREQIDATTKYGLLNLVGTTLFLIATGYLYSIFGTLNMADIALKVRGDDGTLPLGTLATLYLLAFGMKAAAFPVNAWLPASYHTPRISVSALFAGLLTKVGIYALFRVLVMLMPEEGLRLSPAIAVVAGATMILGALGALASSDLRRLLGYWVIAGIGTMLSGLAIGGENGLSGAMLYMAHSMIVMAGLYLAAGAVARVSTSWEIARPTGFYGRYPYQAALALCLLFAVSGLPPFSGLWPKAMLLRAALEGGHPWLALMILSSSFLIMFGAGRLFLHAYWKPAPADIPAAPRESREKSPVAIVAFAAFASLSLGIATEPVLQVMKIAADGLIDPSAYIAVVLRGGGA